MERFAQSLPQNALAIDEQARRVLRFLVTEFVPDLDELPNLRAACPNCGSTLTSTRTPYCSAYCREVSAFVRQFRSGLQDGTILGEDRQVALGQKFWHLAGGGYPLRISLISEKDKLKIIAKKGGLCELCGSPATALDNVGSG